MKKIFLSIIFLFLFSCLSVFADDLGMDDYSNGVENAWYGQKPITDEDFEKTVKQLQDRKNQKQIKKKKKQGQGLYKEDADVSSNPLSEVMDENILLSLSVNLITADETEIPTGHYNIIGKKEKDKVYLEFRQAYSTIAKVEAFETNNDFGEKTINFAKILPHNENYIKIIYGSMDFNAYAFIPVKNGIEGQ